MSTVSSSPLLQRHGEPLFTEPQPAEQRGRPVELQNHLAGVCGGSGLLESPAAAGGHRPPLPGDRLLRQRGSSFLHQPAGAGALRGGQGGGWQRRRVFKKTKQNKNTYKTCQVLLKLILTEQILNFVFLQSRSCFFFLSLLDGEA